MTVVYKNPAYIRHERLENLIKKMQEVNFEKVFEDLKNIQSKVVSKAQYDILKTQLKNSQLEKERLKSRLEYSNGTVMNFKGELSKMKMKKMTKF